ncbi:DUF6188 family protein [Streptomyces sp. NPDC054784]
MTKLILLEESNHWKVHMKDLPVTSIELELALTLHSCGELGRFVVRIEGHFCFTTDGGSARNFNPDEGASSMSATRLLERTSFKEVIAGKNGTLELLFHDGGRIFVPCSEEYEAWTLAGPSRMHLVAVPGGGVAVWPPVID